MKRLRKGKYKMENNKNSENLHISIKIKRVKIYLLLQKYLKGR